MTTGIRIIATDAVAVSVSRTLIETLLAHTKPSHKNDTACVEPDEDRQDIRASQDGDPDAYARLIRRYRGPIAARMWKFTRDRHEYEELVHEVFVEAYFALRRYREMNTFAAWLNRIATRVGYRFWKRQRRVRQTVQLNDPDDTCATADISSAEPDQAADRLLRLLEQLGPRDRLVLTLLYWEGCSVAQTAQQTGWSQTMVKVQAHRARTRLRKLLEQT